MKSDSLSRYVQNYFMSFLIGQRGYGDNTVASYRDTFKLLFVYLKTEAKTITKLCLTDLNRECLVEFLQWLETERKNAVSTRNVRLAHFKSFFGYVMTRSPELADHCCQIIKIPFKKTEKKPPNYLTEAETKTLLQMPDSSSRMGLRHMSMLVLLYDSACRVQELIGLNVSDVTLGRICKVFVKGKGDKFREIPILPETGKVLRQYIDVYGLRPEQPLFLNKQGKRLTRAGIAHIMDKYLSMAKNHSSDFLSEEISPHRMRNSKATHLVNHGVNIYDIRDFLGHVSVATTQVYIVSNPEVTRAAIENAALKTVPDSDAFYSPEEKVDLMQFLEDLI
jgi:site-specific recombinase XerD